MSIYFCSTVLVFSSRMGCDGELVVMLSLLNLSMH